MILIFVFFMYFLASSACHPEPAEPNHQPLTVNVHEGDSYDLLCSRDEFTTIRGCFLITPKDEIYPFWKGANWERGRIKTTIGPTECEAKIEKATKDDSGIWECHVSVQTARQSHAITKKIRVNVVSITAQQVINSENIFFRVT